MTCLIVRVTYPNKHLLGQSHELAPMIAIRYIILADVYWPLQTRASGPTLLP